MVAATADDVGEAGHRGSAADADPGAAVIPERDAELLAGLAKAEESVAAVASDVGFGAAADLTLGDVAADVVL